MNSIRKALADNEDEAVARIRLILNTDVTAGKVLMVVEGKSDADLYKRMYSPSKVEVDSAGGARQVRLVCDKLGKRYGTRFIGIKDADFDVLNGTVYPCSNLFLTDGHDVEIMVLGCPDVVASVWGQYCQSEILPEGLVELIFEELLPLSKWKWYNVVTKSKIVFLEVGDFFSFGVFDYTRYEGALFSETRNQDKMSCKESFLGWEASHANPDRMHVTNGHDAMDGFLQKIRFKQKFKNINKKEFISKVFASYPESIYRNTPLAQRIDAWASGHNYGSLYR